MNEPVSHMNEDPHIVAMAKQDLERGLSPETVEDQYGFLPTQGPMEGRTYPRAEKAKKDADFICGCTTEVTPVAADSNDRPAQFVPPEHRPWRENLPTEEQKAIARARLPGVRALLNKE